MTLFTFCLNIIIEHLLCYGDFSPPPSFVSVLDTVLMKLYKSVAQ